MPEPITIVGGGLAGLTLGIGLRQREVPVTIREAGHYPRHRVCGEFISGDGQRSLARLGLLAGLRAAGAQAVNQVAFFSGPSRLAGGSLPETAWSVSRHFLDAWLAREFVRLGGDLRTGTRWTGEFTAGIVRAGGRRATPVTDGWRLFGLKIHARGVTLEAGLEMHFIPAGYVGICRLPDGEVNLCGLFRSATTVPELGQRWRDWLGGPEESVLHSRLADARFEEASFCSVAGLCLRPQRATEHHECGIGDALTMIPPVTGNGMSMAFESAELAIKPLARFSRGELSWPEAQTTIARACDQRFTSRLRWAAAVQRALFQPLTRAALLRAAGTSAWLWRTLFARTR